jgi:hypothetical protein
MVSTYTNNSGIEKPATGDQSGTWGDTANVNMDIIDRVMGGVGAITLSGTTHTLTTTDGTLSDGMYRVLVLGGSLVSANTVTVSPNDQDKMYLVVNNAGQDVIFTQGSGSNVTVSNGDAKIIYCDGAGAGAAVSDFTANLAMSSVKITGGTIDGTVIGGSSAAAGTFTTFTSTGIDDNASSTAITIDSSQNVGIGTSSPASALTVSDGTVSSLNPFGGTNLFLDSIGSNYLQFGSGTSSSPAIYFGDSADGDVGGIIYAHASNAMSFRTNGSERMRIDSSGNVGIGTTAPAHELDVLGTSDPIIRVRATGSGVSDDSLIRMAVTNASASNYIQFGDTSDSRCRLHSLRTFYE